ncbi:aminoglycoside phosphotransferase family protein [Bacillus sp. FJAT-29790]|uniref:phosphotransferase n=1 Tax=Bacillus sp. FJAT-29790 TaxID=1895002 RepID=UPI001C23EAE7|nr:aminoglycoside phosphotransferase family protein [Bacillus sp. FJAT-29790]
MNSTVNNGGDDFFHNRLFSYLQEQFDFPIDEIQPIRQQVHLVKAKNRTFILKGFSSYSKLKLQEAFSASLIQEGFKKTNTFYQFAEDPPLYFEQNYYGCLEYIHPSNQLFTYHLPKNRLEGLDLLDEFHTATEKLFYRYHSIIPAFKQIEKWQERAAVFLNNLPIIKYFIQNEIIHELLVWMNWSIQGIQKESHLFQNGRKVILHGDVAHHNFLRAKNHDLFLIDFDLISLGTPHGDYLQYANRILPFLNWSFRDLSGYRKMKPFLNEKGFLYALAFPTDIFREWNRTIREKTYLQPLKIRQLVDMTVGQFSERQGFFKELKNQLDKK